LAAILVQNFFCAEAGHRDVRTPGTDVTIKNFKRVSRTLSIVRGEATKMSQKASSAAKGSSKSKSGGSKSKGGFVSRQAKGGKKIPLTTEAELLAKRDAITSKDVLGLEVATQGEYGCQTPPSQSRQLAIISKLILNIRMNRPLWWVCCGYEF
jgi:hypothetical protein